MVNAQLANNWDRQTVLGWLDAVMDPEVPVVSVTDLGIVRDVRAEFDSHGEQVCVVLVTPTYSGCPATGVISQEIESALHRHGVANVRIQMQLSPAWTTDWMTVKGREALRAYGIAPPMENVGATSGKVVDFSALRLRNKVPVPCPRCGSDFTRMLAQFGSTACKALYQCAACHEPFDYFKPH